MQFGKRIAKRLFERLLDNSQNISQNLSQNISENISGNISKKCTQIVWTGAFLGVPTNVLFDRRTVAVVSMTHIFQCVCVSLHLFWQVVIPTEAYGPGAKRSRGGRGGGPPAGPDDLDREVRRTS